tara:strand:- start:598 stop:1008 length:411 start_codon:yes stop_codon:yes gene_type:complete
MISPADQDDRDLGLKNGATATQLYNRTNGSTSSVITSVASQQLVALSQAQFGVEVLNAVAMQLENETAGSSEALVLQTNLTEAQLQDIYAAQVVLATAQKTEVEVVNFSHGTATLVSSKTAVEVISDTKKTKLKKT